MSVNELINRRQQQDEKTEAVTVRIPTTCLGMLDDLAATLNLTRQLLLTEIIKDGVDMALELYEKTQNRPDDNDDEETQESRFFILNTNKRHDKDTHLDMINNGIAAAFCDPWKFQIDRINKGDVVFLYENGVGIVGTGIAPSELEKVEYGGVPDDAYRKKLVDYKRVKPLQAREIKKVIGSNLVFLQTLFKVPKDFGTKIQNHLQEI